MNWIETIIQEAEGFEIETGQCPKEIQISEDDWSDFKAQVVEYTGDEDFLECEDFLMLKGIEIVPNDLLSSQSLIIIK